MKPVVTYVEIDGTPRPVGELHSTVRRGRLRSTFTYDRAYLSASNAYAIEPALPISVGVWPVDLSLPVRSPMRPRIAGDAI